MKLLIDNGASVHSKDQYGNTVLHLAEFRGLEQQVEYLLTDCSADSNAKNNHGLMPFHCAMGAFFSSRR